MVRARNAATNRIVSSKARKRLIVAGPGTGKTHTFKKALEVVGGNGLALTFIRSLVSDLKEGLGDDLAETFTFHAFCTYLLHKIGVDGLSSDFAFYPPLHTLLAEDLGYLGFEGVTPDTVEERLQNLDPTDGVVDHAMSVANYYGAVSFTDVVYRVLRHFESHPADVPDYPLVVVDEYQDFSLLETALIGQLASKNNVLIAGDDDQALYSRRHASAQYIRDLAEDAAYERFELPFCSRCPEVVVKAVNRVVEIATAAGNLEGRLTKPYDCFLPDKRGDSDRYPKLVHADCSVAPYVARYVSDQIERISADDIHESHEGKYPTVLVCGPRQFVRPVHTFLKEGPYPRAEIRGPAAELTIDIADGYRRIATDTTSRLGWRIVLHSDPPEGVAAMVTAAIADRKGLADVVPQEYRVRHLRNVQLLRRFVDEDNLDSEESAALQAAIGLPLAEVREALGEARGDKTEETEAGADPSLPTVVCTTLLGAKGLSAGHVFIVGCNNGHFPVNPNAITDEEVSKLVVALSRTRKQCHLVSSGRFGSGWLASSVFIDWVRPLVDHRRIDKGFWK